MPQMPIASYANSKTLVHHKGRAIQVFRMSIPGFYGEEFSTEILELAAEKAYQRGWRKIILTWGDFLDSCCFDDGYCWLLAVNPDMHHRGDVHYRTDQLLCEMDPYGEVFRPRKEQSEERNFSPFEYDGFDL